MVNMIKSPEYLELKQRWEDFFKNFDKEIKTDAPLLITASALIMKWYRRVIKNGKVLSAKDPDEKFKGQNYTRYVIAKALGHINNVSPAVIAMNRWGKSNPLLVEVIKAAVEGGGSGSGDPASCSPAGTW